MQSKSSKQILKDYLKQWSITVIIGFVAINFSAEVVLTLYFRMISLIEDMSERLLVCGVICVGLMINYLLKYRLIVVKGHSIDKYIHESVFRSLLHATVEFYAEVQMGQLMTRLTNDLRLIDSILHSTIALIFEIFSYFLISLITILVFSPVFVVFVFLLFTFYALVVYYYSELVVDSREVDLIQRGKLFQLTSLTIGGRTVLDSFNYTKTLNSQFASECNKNINSNLFFYQS